MRELDTWDVEEELGFRLSKFNIDVHVKLLLAKTFFGFLCGLFFRLFLGFFVLRSLSKRAGQATTLHRHVCRILRLLLLVGCEMLLLLSTLLRLCAFLFFSLRRRFRIYNVI